MKNNIFSLCLIVLCLMAFPISCRKGNKIDFTSEQFVGKSERVKEIKSIDEMKKVINNSIWTHSKEDYLWHKLHFKDNIVEQYTALLSNSKEWEYLGSSPYTLKKGRFPEGIEYISAEFMIAKGDVPAEFVFTNCHLYISGIDFGVFNNVDIEW